MQEPGVLVLHLRITHRRYRVSEGSFIKGDGSIDIDALSKSGKQDAEATVIVLNAINHNLVRIADALEAQAAALEAQADPE